MTTKTIDPRSLALAVGITEKEWAHLLSVLGRTPTTTEIQMIGVMWSEHCSYKSSKIHLKNLMTKGPQVLQGPGENAGLVELDEKHAIAFKVESHNHPSFVEPFQGSATGVGGILRDIFTMGARPIAVGDYLRFGDFRKSIKHKHLLDGVVSGIAHYGNCMGIPTVAGHIATDESYDGNILVNVFALGIVEREKIFKSNSGQPGHTVMLWGAKTGRDGIHGASLLASADFESNKTETKEQKIRVQVGDPFKEKVLMEATLECMEKLGSDLLSIQDMGAAGITCSTMEISAKSGIGMRIDLDRVPMREPQMQAFEILLSESQERMLAIVRRGTEEKFQKIVSEKWGCECAAIGETLPTSKLEMFFEGAKVVDLPAQDLIDPPPADLPAPEILKEDLGSADFQVEDVRKEWEVLESLLAHPSVANKKNVYQRYDSTVGAKTVLGPGHEAATLWIPNSKKAVAFKGVALEYYSGIDSKFGASASLAKAVTSLALVGAKATAYTDGINLGNPNRPHIQAALQGLVSGLNETAEVFKTPCISGNVSLYNQTQSDGKTTDILPTTFVVAVGLLPEIDQACPSVFQKAGSEVWLLEASQESEALPNGSLYARICTDSLKLKRTLPYLNLAEEKNLVSALLEANANKLFLSTRGISEGGLAVSLVKSCFEAEKTKFGFDGDLSKTQTRRDALLFGEGFGRAIVEIDPTRRAELMKLSMTHKLQAKRLGTVTEEKTYRLRSSLSGPIDRLHEVWSSTFG